MAPTSLPTPPQKEVNTFLISKKCVFKEKIYKLKKSKF
jgi:hypothetical protein